MKYLTSIQFGLIGLIFFIILSIKTEGHGFSQQIGLILTVSSFLFAILAGSFISKSNTRFKDMRNCEGRIDALLITIYKIAQMQGKEFSDKIKEHINNYNMMAYDIELKDADKTYKMTNKHFLKIWDELIDRKKTISPTVSGGLTFVLRKLEEYRKLTSALSKERIQKSQWIILIILSSIIIFSLYCMKTNEFTSIIITTLLSTVLLIILLILRDTDNLRTGDGLGILEESGQEVFEIIGELRYYNITHLKNGRNKVPENVRKYRLGLHKAGEKMNIIIVDKDKGQNDLNAR